MAELSLEQSPDLGDYLAILKRRIRMIIIIASIVLITGLVIAYTLPPVYESKSTILIEQQEIPSDLVRTTVTSYAGKRIQVISQKVMTRTNLMETVDKYDLYADNRKNMTVEEIIGQMREDIIVDMVTASVVDPRSGNPTKAMIAFSIGFTGEDPRKIQKVASELTTLYLNENLKTRAEKTEETSEFLEAEARRLNAEIERMDAEMASFNEEYMGNLPGSKAITTSLLQSVKSNIEAIDNQVIASNETVNYLQGQLALLEPHESNGESMGPAARLHSLRSSLSFMSNRYSDDHPDIRSMKRDIAALEKELGTSDSAEILSGQLESLRSELRIAEQRYSQDHPDIKSLKHQISSLEGKIANMEQMPDRDVLSEPPPTNEAYITLKSQIEKIGISQKLARKRQARLREKQAEYEQRLLEMPAIEGKYRALSRDYANTSARYQELKAKQMTADVAMEMEKKRKGEKFTLIDPAIVPSTPVSPNRPAIVILSLILALGSGLGSAFVAESISTSVRGINGLISILNTAPLAIIPYLDNDADITKKKTRFKILIASGIVGVIIIVVLINFFYSPLDVLFFRGLRKVDTIVGG